MSRDFSKALENIRKAINELDSDFRREAGLGPKQPKPAPKIPSLKPEPQPSHEDSGGKFAANRFLETSIGQEPVPEPQTQNSAPEIVEVIPQKDSRHSWLYNEVAKAVQNASDGNPNTKVVAVFVPVVQSSKEFEELPVTHSVELPPVHEEDFNPEDEIEIQEDPVTSEEEPQEPEIPSPTDELPQEPEEPAPTESEPQESEEQDIPEELSEEPEQAEHLGELIPESMEHPDPELAEAFTTMEEKLDESIAADQDLPEPEENPEIAEEVSGLPELDLPDELEDDEIIDDIDESSEDTKTL